MKSINTKKIMTTDGVKKMNENKYLNDLDDDFVSKQPIYKDISNFSDLDSLIKSGKKEIILENDIILDLNCNEKEKYADGIKITTNNLVIDGKGYSIDALGKVSIFETMGKNITIRNLTLKNGFNEVKGGAVSNYDELLIYDCNFLENTSQDIGGAVYNHDNTNLTINKSKFYNNEAKNSQLLSLGGVIYNNGGLIKIIDSDFKYNTSDIAGAIFNCNWGHISMILQFYLIIRLI